jgi:uncharacterized protein YjbI with pentapeptide repeats
MPNPEHLEILTHRVEVWDEWRTRNPRITPSVRKANLRGSNLWMANLNNDEFNQCDTVALVNCQISKGY